jgi:hypothetical protein
MSGFSCVLTNFNDVCKCVTVLHTTDNFEIITLTAVKAF